MIHQHVVTVNNNVNSNNVSDKYIQVRIQYKYTYNVSDFISDAPYLYKYTYNVSDFISDALDLYKFISTHNKFPMTIEIIEIRCRSITLQITSI